MEFKPLFSFFDRNLIRSKNWKRPIPEKFEDRDDIRLLSLEERRQRALQLWAIGIRKAKIIKQIINVIKLYGASKIIDENLNLDGDQDGIKCIVLMDPNSKFSQGWAMITTTSLMITGLYVPYNAAFGGK
jgi:hypothetical protein